MSEAQQTEAARFTELMNVAIPGGRQNLLDSHKNLLELATYCEQHYDSAANEKDKQLALEESKQYAVQSLASVAYMVNAMATHVLELFNHQHSQMCDLESTIHHIKQNIDIHKEKVARREIGAKSKPKRNSRVPKISVTPGLDQGRPYRRVPLNYNSLDKLGHGLAKSTSAINTAATTQSSAGTPVREEKGNQLRGSTRSITSQRSANQFFSPPQSGTFGMGAAESPSFVPSPVAPKSPPGGTGMAQQSVSASPMQSIPQAPPGPPPGPPPLQAAPPTAPVQSAANIMPAGPPPAPTVPMMGAAPAAPRQPNDQPDPAADRLVSCRLPPPSSSMPPPPSVSMPPPPAVAPVAPASPFPPPLAGNPPVSQQSQMFSESLPSPPAVFVDNTGPRRSGDSMMMPPPPSPGDMGVMGRDDTLSRNDRASRRRSTADLPPPGPPPDEPPPRPPSPIEDYYEDPAWAPQDYIEKVKAIYAYEKCRHDELSFEEDALIFVTRKNADGWYEGVIEPGITGVFPGNYVECESDVTGL